MKTLRKISKIIDVFVFISTTLAMAGVFYEGMKITGIDYPAITLVLWYFYIWFLYGALNIKIFGWPKDSFLLNAQWRGHEK